MDRESGRRQRRERQADARDPGSARSGRPIARNRLLALAILVVLALAAVAPAGQASSNPQAGVERAQQRALRAAQHTAERESRRLLKAEARATRTAQLKAQREQARHLTEQGTTSEIENVAVTIECTRIVISYRNFPAVPGSTNTVSEKVIFKQGTGLLPTYAFPTTSFSFSGSAAQSVIPIAAPLGQSTVGFRMRYDINGLKGAFRPHASLFCGPITQYTLSTEQSLGGPFTPSTLPGTVGQPVVYQTVATNTGNTPITFTSFSDPGCEGMIAGGSAAAVPPRGTATFVCSHTLSDADRTAGLFADAASVTGTPEPGQGEPTTLASSGVIVSPIAAGPEKATEVTSAAAPAGATSSAAGPPAAPGAAPKGGVLSFIARRIPSLLGPARCVRSGFTAGVKSDGVSNVTFYLDGHRIARRTAHSTKSGMISIRINGAKLKPGRHRMRADITMTPASPTAAAASGWRSRSVRRCAASSTRTR